MQLSFIWEVLNSFFSLLRKRKNVEEILRSRTIVIMRVLVYVIQAITNALIEKKYYV